MNLVIVLVLLIVGGACGSVVVSIDLGNAFIKNGLIKHGQNPDMVHDEMGRKFSSFVYISGSERHVADRAREMFRRDPSVSFGYFTSISAIHLSADQRFIDTHRTLFPFYSIIPSVGFGGAGNRSHSIEEIIAILLEFSVERSTKFAGSDVSFTTVAVPNYYTQAQRRLLLTAANLVEGVRIDVLMNANVATAYYYALFFDPTKTLPPVIARNTTSSIAFDLMVIDVGAMSVQASVFRLVMPSASQAASKRIPRMVTLSSEADPSLGTSSFMAVIRDGLSDRMVKTGVLTPTSAKEDPMVIARLSVHAEVYLNKLSLLNEYTTEIDDVSDHGARLTVKRADFEANPKTKEILEGMSRPIHRALEIANLSGAQLAYVLSVGGGSRIPCVEQMIKQTLNRSSLDRRANADDDVAMGSAFFGAAKSNYFVIKKINVRDVINFGVRIYERNQKTTVFEPNLKYPRRIILRLKSSPKQLAEGATLKLTTYDHGTGDKVERDVMEIVLDKIEGTSKDSFKGVNVTVSIDENQIVSVSNITAVFEHDEVQSISQTDTTTIARIGNKLSAVFGFSSNTSVNETENAQNASTVESMSKIERKPIRVVTNNVMVGFKVNYVDMRPLSDSEKKEIIKNLRVYKDREAALDARHKSTNELQELSGRWRAIIADEAHEIRAIDPSEFSGLSRELNDVYDWVDEILLMDPSIDDDLSGKTSLSREIDNRLRNLKTKLAPIERRVHESKNRAPAISALNATIQLALSLKNGNSLNISLPIMSNASNKSISDIVATSNKTVKLDEKAREVAEWLEQKIGQQSKLKAHEDPILKTVDIKQKQDNLERLLKKTISELMTEMFRSSLPKKLNNSEETLKADEIVKVQTNSSSLLNSTKFTETADTASSENRSHGLNTTDDMFKKTEL